MPGGDRQCVITQQACALRWSTTLVCYTCAWARVALHGNRRGPYPTPTTQNRAATPPASLGRDTRITEAQSSLSSCSPFATPAFDGKLVDCADIGFLRGGLRLGILHDFKQLVGEHRAHRMNGLVPIQALGHQPIDRPPDRQLRRARSGFQHSHGWRRASFRAVGKRRRGDGSPTPGPGVPVRREPAILRDQGRRQDHRRPRQSRPPRFRRRHPPQEHPMRLQSRQKQNRRRRAVDADGRAAAGSEWAIRTARGRKAAFPGNQIGIGPRRRQRRHRRTTVRLPHSRQGVPVREIAHRPRRRAAAFGRKKDRQPRMARLSSRRIKKRFDLLFFCFTEQGILDAKAVAVDQKAGQGDRARAGLAGQDHHANAARRTLRFAGGRSEEAPPPPDARLRPGSPCSRSSRAGAFPPAAPSSVWPWLVCVESSSIPWPGPQRG